MKVVKLLTTPCISPDPKVQHPEALHLGRLLRHSDNFMSNDPLVHRTPTKQRDLFRERRNCFVRWRTVDEIVLLLVQMALCILDHLPGAPRGDVVEQVL